MRWFVWGAEGLFQAPVKTLHQPVGLGVVGRGSVAARSEEDEVVTPCQGLKLRILVGATQSERKWDAVPSAVMSGIRIVAPKRVTLSTKVRR